MEDSTIKIDKAAIGLSMLCIAHCLLTPIAIVMLPALGATFLDDERFHYALLFLVIPTSIFSLGLGCRKHGRREILMFGLFGFANELNTYCRGRCIGRVRRKNFNYLRRINYRICSCSKF